MPIILPEKPQMRDAAAFRAAALEAIEAGRLTIDGSAVTSLPLCWVQLLASAARSAAARGSPVVALNPSFAFLFCFEAIGIDAEAELFQLEYAA